MRPFLPSSYVTTIPVPSSEDRAAAAGWNSGGTWRDQHRDIVSIRDPKQVRLVFLGDSITQSWGGPGRAVADPGAEVFEANFARFRAVNFGISGDRTQHVLWRIDQGAFSSVRPKVIVLMIGTNNLGDDSAEQIAQGIGQIVYRLEEKCPQTKILLLGIFPRGTSPDDPLRKKLRDVNQRIAALHNGRSTIFLDLANQFLNTDRTLNASLFAPDSLHLSRAGYEKWAQAVSPVIGGNDRSKMIELKRSMANSFVDDVQATVSLPELSS